MNVFLWKTFFQCVLSITTINIFRWSLMFMCALQLFICDLIKKPFKDSIKSRYVYIIAPILFVEASRFTIGASNPLNIIFACIFQYLREIRIPVSRAGTFANRNGKTAKNKQRVASCRNVVYYILRLPSLAQKDVFLSGKLFSKCHLKTPAPIFVPVVRLLLLRFFFLFRLMYRVRRRLSFQYRTRVYEILYI